MAYVINKDSSTGIYIIFYWISENNKKIYLDNLGLKEWPCPCLQNDKTIFLTKDQVIVNSYLKCHAVHIIDTGPVNIDV